MAILICMAVVAAGVWVMNSHLPVIEERTGTPVGEKVERTESEWKKLLTDEQFYVTRQKGTERPFTGAYWNTKEDGVYKCICCGQVLFDARNKFDSGCGWPSFYSPSDEEHITYRPDNNHFMQRTEIVCSKCDAHLGHVFDDGPPPTGKRFCINSASLKLEKRDQK